MDNKKSCKYKSTALALAVSMVLSNPLVLTGCSNQAPDKEKEEDEQAQQSSYHSTSPFVFIPHTSSSNRAAITNQSPKSWQAWTTPNSNGGYSGIHAGSVAG